MRRRFSLFKPVLFGFGAGIAYLMVKEDMKRKSENKANFADAIKDNGVNLVTDPELRKGVVELAKTEAEGIKKDLGEKAQQLKEKIQSEKEELSKEFDSAIEEIKNMGEGI